MSASRKKEEAPPHALARLASALEGGELAPAYLLRGEERWFRERMAELVTHHAARRGLEVCRHDAKHPEFSLARLCDDLRGGALFASARCVLVHHAGSLVNKTSKDYSAPFTELVAARMARPEGGTIVLAAESLGTEHALVKSAAAAGGWLLSCRKLWDTPPPWGASDPARIELVVWFMERARSEGVRLDAQEALLVVQAIGNDLWALEGELARLRERGERPVAEVIGWQAGASPWTVADDVARGDARAGAKGVEALFRGGFQGRDGSRTLDQAALSVMLLNAIQGKVREALAASELIGRGASEEDALAFAGASGARAQESLRARMAARAPSAWRAMLEETAALERRSHTGTPLDANDFQLLVLRWRVRAPARS